MFGSPILDAVIGVIFGFLAISLFTSAFIEALNSWLKLRAANLQTAIKEMVNDPGFAGLALELYRHALISPFGTGGATPASAYADKSVLPSYIDKTHFARALLDVTHLTPSLAAVTQAVSVAQTAANAANAAAATPPAPDAIATARTTLDGQIATIQDPQIRDFLKSAVERAAGDIAGVEKEVADWFDVSMDRLSGAFKRQSQLWTFGVALIASVIVNIDSIHVGRQIWAHPDIARNVKLTDLAALGADDKHVSIEKLTSLLGDDFPIGWPSGVIFAVLDAPKAGEAPDKAQMRLMNWSEFGSSVIGWLVTAFAALFGAPFWFDTLQSVVRLKGSGPSPDEKQDGTAASA